MEEIAATIKNIPVSLASALCFFFDIKTLSIFF